ncbi:MAG: hypothetical protein U0Q12_04935 [Vicinamibacterales bacterium]
MFQVPRAALGHPRFGDVVILAFLVTQAMDGVFTYLGVHVFGPQIEANPLIGTLIGSLGVGTGLFVAKGVAVSFGIALHLVNVHRVVALLTGLYVSAAIVPWTRLLFF